MGLFWLLTASFVAGAQLASATPSIQVLTPSDSIHLAKFAEKLQSSGDEYGYEEFTKFCQIDANDGNTAQKRRQVGVAAIDEELALALQQKAGVDPFRSFSSLQKDGSDQIRSVCSLLTQSSRRHTDRVKHIAAMSDDPSHFKADQMVDRQQVSKAAFVFLESNPDAYFSYGDAEYPVVQGHMLVFDGRVPHQTIIHDGTVKLLGPLDAHTFRSVGTDTPGFVPDFSFPFDLEDPGVVNWLLVASVVVAAIAGGALMAALVALLQ